MRQRPHKRCALRPALRAPDRRGTLASGRFPYEEMALGGKRLHWPRRMAGARQKRTLSSRVFARGGAAMRPKSVRASTVAALSKQFDYLEKKVKLSRRLCPVRGDGR